jgi:hypothetical protein
MSILEMQAELQLHSRMENQIANFTNRKPAIHGEFLLVADLKKQFKNAIIATYLHRAITIAPDFRSLQGAPGFKMPKTLLRFLEKMNNQLVDAAEVEIGDMAVYYISGDADIRRSWIFKIRIGSL